MRKDSFSFEGKTAVVTGGTRGIGGNITKLLAELGCNVIYTGTKPVKEGIDDRRCKYHPLDLLNDKSVLVFVEILKKEKVDILINNAGTNLIEPINELSIANFEKVIKINLTGAAALMKAASKSMIENNIKGKILNISSIFGMVSKEKRNSYSASKTGLIGLTRASALDLASYGILVNAICPGFTLTDLTTSILSKEEMKILCDAIPLKRFAATEEIAKAAVFLCSDQNTYMTGQVLVVDGGFTAL